MNRTLSVRSEAALEPLGLRPRQLVALTMLRDHPDIPQQDLARTLQIDRTNLVGLLNELEDLGRISRTRSTQDRRRHVVALTEKGARLLAKAEFALAAVEDEVFATLTEAERETLHAVLFRVVAAGQPDVACTAGGGC